MSILNHASVQIPDAAVQAAMSKVLLTKAEALDALTAAIPYLFNAGTKPVDVASLAHDLLVAWDQQYSCMKRDDATKALSDKLILAACFAGIAYDAAMSLPIMEDKAPEFLLRIFLIALVDQNSSELAPYRAKNRSQPATLTNEVTKPVDVTAGQSDLDARLKAAGMYSVAELMAGTPVDKWRAHSSMDNLQFFGEWLERKTREYKVMAAGYDIGDKDKSDELYEWVLAHSGAFHDVLVNFRAAICALSPAEPAQGDQWHSGLGRLPTLQEAQQAARVLNACNGVDLSDWTDDLWPCDDLTEGLKALLTTAPTSEAGK